MSWTAATLGEISDIQTGPFGSQLHSKDYTSGEGTPIVTVEHLGERKFTRRNLPLVSDDDRNRLQRYTMRAGDIIFSRVGSVDRCSLAMDENDGWLFSGRCLRIRPHRQVDSNYLYSYLTLPNVKQFIRNIAVGATMPSINTAIMGEVPVSLPPLKTQAAIGDFSRRLNDKIELNNLLNDYLLQLSTTIFESALKSECRKELFGDIVELEDSKRIPLNSRDREQRRGPYPYYGATSIMGYVDDYLFDDIRILLGEDGSVITDDGRPVLQYVWGKYWVNNHAHILKPCSDYSLEMLFIALSRTTISHIVTGAVQKKISQKNLNTLVLEMPSPGHVEELCGLFSLYRANIDQNKRLEQLRDALLPKLMAGEIDVSRIDITTQSNNHLDDC